MCAHKTSPASHQNCFFLGFFRVTCHVGTLHQTVTIFKHDIVLLSRAYFGYSVISFISKLLRLARVTAYAPTAPQLISIRSATAHGENSSALAGDSAETRAATAAAVCCGAIFAATVFGAVATVGAGVSATT